MGSLAITILVSLARVTAGYFLAVLIAAPLGVLMGYYGSVFNLSMASWAFSAERQI